MNRAFIARLIPHAGKMCLLRDVQNWSADFVLCTATSHLKPDNPLRRAGQLSMVCGVEYALQAAALHGALLSSSPQPQGYLASLRLDLLFPGRLDNPSWNTLYVAARREHAGEAGLIYGFSVVASQGKRLIEGRATIALPSRP